MRNDLEAAEPLLDKPKSSFKRKDRSRQHSSVIMHSSPVARTFNKLYSDIEPKLEKQKNKFLFKVYLHLLFQSILIFIMLFFAFRNIYFSTLLIENNIIYYAALILLVIGFIQPLISDQILKNYPQNYIFLFIFTLCISYILCKEAILFDFYLIMIMSILNIIEILYLTIESYVVKNNEKTGIDIANTATFMGLCILFIGSILCFLKKISIIKFSIILLILLVLGVYILYDMNCIFLDKRRRFVNTEYVLATVFLYIDIFQAILELLEKFYNSCEPERKPTRKHATRKSMIYTGDEAYTKLYRKVSEEKAKKGNEENNVRHHTKRMSSSDYKRKNPFLEKNPIFEDVNEDNYEENEKKEDESPDELSEDKEAQKGKDNLENQNILKKGEDKNAQ